MCVYVCVCVGVCVCVADLFVLVHVSLNDSPGPCSAAPTAVAVGRKSHTVLHFRQR